MVASSYRRPLPGPLMQLRARVLLGLYGPRLGDARDRVRADGFDLLVEDDLADPRPKVGLSPWSLLGHHLDARPGEQVLDLHPGCGLVAIHAASRGATVSIVEPSAAGQRCARRNSLVAGWGAPTLLDGRFLEAVPSASIDLITWVPGFLGTTAAQPSQRPLIRDDAALSQVFAELPRVLRRGGRLLLPFPDVDAVPVLHSALVKAGLRFTTARRIFRPVWGPTRLYRIWPAPAGQDPGELPGGDPLSGAGWVLKGR